MILSDAERLETPPNFDYGAFELPENVALDFVLNAHVTKHDLPEETTLSATIKQSDAVIIESICRPGNEGMYSKIARGDAKYYAQVRAAYDTPYRPGQAERMWTLRMASALYATRVGFAHIDINTTDKLAKKTFDSLDTIARQVILAESDEDVLGIAPTVEAYFSTQQERDQLLLCKLTPALGELSMSNKSFGRKRDERVVNVLAFYGSMHRSLPDALQHQQSLQNTEGFSVTVADGSDTRYLEEELYARYLRELPAPDKLFLQTYATQHLTTTLLDAGYIPAEMPTSQLNAFAKSRVTNMSFSQLHDLRTKLLSGSYRLHIPTDAEEPLGVVPN